MEKHPQAKKIIDTLTSAGFIAYYAGGWVRDFLLNHPSDDIDIATNAPPETIQSLFPRTIPIGISFGIVLVIIDEHQYEVATFRQDLDYKDGRRPSRIEFTTAREDAKRRDFTINGMFYDPLKEEVLDFVNGKADLEKKVIRAIGNPHERIKEDRLRMIRAVRLSGRFGFSIDPDTVLAIKSHAKELFPAVSIERIWQEFSKGHFFGKLRPMLVQLHEFGLLSSIFPDLEGENVEEIEKRLIPIQDYPRNAPVIASLLPLFPEASLDDQLKLCKRLKLSNLDYQFVTILFQIKSLIQSQSPELAEWAHLYANPSSDLCLHILKVHLDPKEQKSFQHEHDKRIEILSHSIERIQKRNPVVTSKDLMKEGIKPGRIMGLLLQEAVRVSINEQIFEPKPIIERLKKMPIWPKSNK